MNGPGEVELGAWVAQLRALREAGWVVFDWLGVVEEPPHGAPGGGSGDEASELRLVVQLLRPHDATDAAGAGAAHGEPAGYGRLQVRTRVPPGANAPSLTGLWPGAAWHEREAWEMFGLAFDGFTDHTGLGLRPLLLDGIHGLDGLDRLEGHDDGRSPAVGPVPPYPPPLRKSALLPARTGTPWPGAVEPGESPPDALSMEGGPADRVSRARPGSRRRQRPLGVPAPGPGLEGAP